MTLPNLNRTGDPLIELLPLQSDVMNQLDHRELLLEVFGNYRFIERFSGCLDRAQLLKGGSLGAPGLRSGCYFVQFDRINGPLSLTFRNKQSNRLVEPIKSIFVFLPKVSKCFSLSGINGELGRSRGCVRVT